MKKILVYVGLLMFMLVMPMFVVRAAVAETDVAKIGDTGYATLEAAATSSRSGDIIVVLKSTSSADDLFLKDGVTLDIPASTTLTLNGEVSVGDTAIIKNNGVVAVGGILDLSNIPSTTTTGLVLDLAGVIAIKSSGTVVFPNAWKTTWSWKPTMGAADHILKYGVEKNATIAIGEESFVYTGANTDAEGTGYDKTNWKGAVAIGTDNYTTLKSAVDAAETGQTLKLLGHVTSDAVMAIDGGRNLTLDLNNHDTYFTARSQFEIENGSLNITGVGTMNTADDVVALYGSATSTDENYSKVTVGKMVTIIGSYPIWIDNNAGKNYGTVIEFSGKMKVEIPGVGIYINGTVANTTGAIPKIHIYPEAQIIADSTESAGIYAAGYAEWIIDGATITGNDSALAIKAGKFVIRNSKLSSDGPCAVPTMGWSNGINASGAAIQIESNKAYAGKIDISIESGEFVSKNAPTIYEYVPTGTLTTNVESIKISGGKFVAGGLYDVFKMSEKLIDLGTEYITGGLFESNPTRFLVEGYRTYINENDMFAIGKIVAATGTAKISGTVTIPTDTTAVVQLRQGATILKTVQLGSANAYEFLKVADGDYNVSVVGTKSTIMKTVKVAGKNVDLDITLPETGAQEVVIEGANTPAVVVNGLDQVSPGNKVEAIVELIAPSAEFPGLEAIKEEEKTNKSLLVLDLTLTVDGVDANVLGDKVVEFLVPFTDTGASNLKLYRYHDNEVEVLTALTELPETPTEGSFFFDKTAKVIHVYAGKFSVYAVTYTASPNPKTGDNIGIYALISLISVIGVCSVVFAKKRFN